MDALAEDVRRGLSASQKWLPPYLFYDARGSELFGAITGLPEYYPTRTERAIFEAKGEEIMSAALPDGVPASVMELGAGTAEKSQLLLSALSRRVKRVEFLPVDVSPEPLALCVARFAREAPAISVRPMVMQNDAAFEALSRVPWRRTLLFIGSSIGNLSDEQAISLLQQARRALSPGEALVLGADRKKDLSILLPAYDDAAGVTAAFNKNLLARLNRELGATFDLDRFAHQARWNESTASIEMHLVSRGTQEVQVSALDLRVSFRDGESIHTESSAKYDQARLDRIFACAGFAQVEVFSDPQGWFGVHVARAC